MASVDEIKLNWMIILHKKLVEEMLYSNKVAANIAYEAEKCYYNKAKPKLDF